LHSQIFQGRDERVEVSRAVAVDVDPDVGILDGDVGRPGRRERPGPAVTLELLVLLIDRVQDAAGIRGRLVGRSLIVTAGVEAGVIVRTGAGLGVGTAATVGETGVTA